MQVFLPDPDAHEVARVLDDKRLFKQTVESYQLVGGLLRQKLVTEVQVGTRWTRPHARADKLPKPPREVPVMRDLPEAEWHLVPRMTERTWGDHTVGQMWAGSEEFLLEYTRVLAAEWRRRGHRETCAHKIDVLLSKACTPAERLERSAPPPWYQDVELRDRVCQSHRRALVWKDPEHYGPIWPDEPAEYAYVWPVSATPKS